MVKAPGCGGERPAYVKECSTGPIVLREVSDDGLMRLTKEGHRPAFEVLVKRHRPAMMAFARRMLGTADAAGDAVQDTFIEIYRYVPNYHAQGRFQHLLFRILANRCRMSFRAQRSFEGFQTRLGRAVQPQPIDALERMLQSEAQGALWSAIQLLSPKLKQVLMLRLVRGLSYQAIAAELSIPVGTVKSRINLATKRLRPCFS